MSPDNMAAPPSPKVFTPSRYLYVHGVSNKRYKETFGQIVLKRDKDTT